MNKTIFKTVINNHIRVYGIDQCAQNIGVIGTVDDGLLLIDSLPSDFMTSLINIFKETATPKVVVHTHCHRDHCEGDEMLSEAFPVLFAKQLDMIEIEKARFDDFKWSRPSLSISPSPLIFSGVKIQVEYTGGHSFDSVYYFLPEYGVLFAGENFINSKIGMKCVPKLSRHGDPRKMIIALEKFLSLNCSVLIPAHGEPVFEAKNCIAAIEDNLSYLYKFVEYMDCCRKDIMNLDAIERDLPPIDSFITHFKNYNEISGRFHRKNCLYMLNLLRKDAL